MWQSGSSDQHQKRTYEHKLAAQHQYHCGQAVWYYNSPVRKGRCQKLMSLWNGPYIVVGQLNDVTYLLQQGPWATSFSAHVDQMKPASGDAPPRWYRGVVRTWVLLYFASVWFCHAARSAWRMGVTKVLGPMALALVRTSRCETCRRLIIEPGHPQVLLYRPGDWQVYQPVFLSGSKIWRFHYSCATFFYSMRPSMISRDWTWRLYLQRHNFFKRHNFRQETSLLF